jgi:hypothetical protein
VVDPVVAGSAHTTAFSLGFSRAICARWASSASVAEMRRARMAAVSSVAVAWVGFCMVSPILPELC